MTDHEICERIKCLAGQLPAAELPALLGQLETAKAIAFARLTSPAPVQPQADELLDVATVSARLGVSTQYLYRHHGQLPFARHLGRKLLFSANGIEEYIRAKR